MTLISTSDLSRIGYFALYTCWLAAFAMSGPLQTGGSLLLYFLIPHIGGLWVLTRESASRWFRTVLPIGLVVCVLGTAWYSVAGALAPGFMMILGAVAAPVSLRASIALRASAQPVLNAAIALTLGNLLALGLINLLPSTPDLGLILLAIGLLVLMKAPVATATYTQGSVIGIGRFLPSIFCFQIVSGLMYGGLFPEYAEYGITGDTRLEVVGYVAGAWLAWRWLKRDTIGITLVAGVLLALLGFSLWRLLPTPWGVNVGMFITLGAAGCIDLFFLSHVLSFRNQLKASGYGVAVLCAGIACGKWLALQVGDNGETLGLVGLVVLNFAVIALYVVNPPTSAAADRDTDSQVDSGVTASDSEGLDALPTELRALLSAQEQLVLAQIVQGKIYREIALTLRVSESTVKTYVQRIYRKLDVRNRQQLVALLRPAKPDSP